MALNVKRVRGLKKPGRYLDGGGLYLQVMSNSNRSWLLRYERQSRERWMGLGSAELFSLQEARERAREAHRLLADGIDPIDARRGERAKQAAEAARSKSFAEVAADYYDVHEASWSAKHRSDFTGSLRDHVHPKLGALPIASIDEPLVLAVLQPIWHDKTATAKRVRARIESVLDFADAAGYRSGDNPGCAELPAFMRELRAVEGIAARALEFLILTAVRTEEARLARWSEIDLAQRDWTIPKEAHEVAERTPRAALGRAIAPLRALPREGDVVFVGAKAGAAIGNNAMLVTLKALRPDATCTACAPHFATLPKSAQASLASLPRWRWLTLSATPWRTPIDAASCSPSARS